MSNLLLDRGEAFATEIVESVRDLPRMVPDVANLAGAFLHTCEQETPHVHAYYQRRHMPQVRPCASCVSVEFCWLIWHVAPLALLDVFNIHIMSLKRACDQQTHFEDLQKHYYNTYCTRQVAEVDEGPVRQRHGGDVVG
jgi:hypothetical protein